MKVFEHPSWRRVSFGRRFPRHGPSCCRFHVDRLRVSLETEIVASGLVGSDLAYPRVSSGQYPLPWSKDPFLPVIQGVKSWFAPTYDSGRAQRLFYRFTSISLSARATDGSPGVSPGGGELLSLDFVCPPAGFPVIISSRLHVVRGTNKCKQTNMINSVLGTSPICVPTLPHRTTGGTLESSRDEKEEGDKLRSQGH